MAAWRACITFSAEYPGAEIARLGRRGEATQTGISVNAETSATAAWSSRSYRPINWDGENWRVELTNHYKVELVYDAFFNWESTLSPVDVKE